MDLKFNYRTFEGTAKEFANIVRNSVNDKEYNGIRVSYVTIKSCGDKNKDDLMMEAIHQLDPMIWRISTVVDSF